MRSLLSRLALLCAGLAVISAGSSPPRAEIRTAGTLAIPLLPRAAFLKGMWPGFATFVADYYWIQLIQAGGSALLSQDYLSLYYYADLISDLDPKFRTVYQFAGVLVPFNRGRETWDNVAESNKILRKGLETFPADRQLRALLAHNLVFYERDYAGGAEIFLELSKDPSAPKFYGLLATRLLAQAGDFEKGSALARVMIETSGDPELKEHFKRRLVELELERTLQAVDKAAMAYWSERGELPRDVVSLVASGHLPSLPRDPFGGEISIDAMGRAQSTSSRFRLEAIEHQLKTMGIQGTQYNIEEFGLPPAPVDRPDTAPPAPEGPQE